MLGRDFVCLGATTDQGILSAFAWRSHMVPGIKPWGPACNTFTSANWVFCVLVCFIFGLHLVVLRATPGFMLRVHSGLSVPCGVEGIEPSLASCKFCTLATLLSSHMDLGVKFFNLKIFWGLPIQCSGEPMILNQLGHRYNEKARRFYTWVTSGWYE